MRITAIEPFVCDGGLREFGFLKVTTDEGIVGWAETYDWHPVASLATAIAVMGRELIGEDPRRIELVNERIWYRRPARHHGTDQGPRGDRHRALGHQGQGWACRSTSCSAASSATGSRCTGSHFASYRGVWPEIVGADAETTYAEWAAGRPRRRRAGLQGPQDEPHRSAPGTAASRGSRDYRDGAIDNRHAR